MRGTRVQSLPVVVIGFLLGMLHATDADHVVAVSTIVSQQRKVGSAARVGVLWGVGHTLTVLLVGSAIILFNLAIPPQVGLAMEFAVALMLILLGVVTLARVSRHVRDSMTSMLADGLSGHRHPEDAAQPHLHVHAHGDYVHAHRHGHGSDGHGHGETPQGWLDRRLGGLTLYQALRPVAIGIVHGLAGSAAVALLVLAQIREPGWAVAYLLLFGVGTMAGMMLVTSLIALPFAASHRLPYLNLALRVLAGVLSLALGVYLVWKIGVVDGLLTGMA
jgi:high-affinity nickel-transport protein